MKLKQLFDSKRDIHRTIEKVIKYDESQVNRLRGEISEYVVTDHIEEQFEGLLSKMQLAMQAGGEHEIGVWVSGFYGSGKSSFTKYLGMALDDQIKVDGEPFLKHLQDRFKKPQTKALLSTVAKQHSAAVILLDLASEMLTGATMEEISTVLFYKVLKWAGYSPNIKVAAFERKLQKDNRYDEFRKIVRDQLNAEWSSVQRDPLAVDSIIPDIAHRMYPAIFRTSSSFSTEKGEFVQFENDRVQEMLEIARQKSGKQQIIFVIDEVGQYVASRQNLILNLDGLAKNLKSLGGGKVWIMATAQQTLTEDDPRAALNSPELYKLNARFPIQIDLESSDIRAICYERLLGKSVEGKKILGDLFEKKGQSLRHATKLQDAKYYDTDFDQKAFVNLYPFLPAHFDILLHLLGALAKSTGGIGLRSAIKVIQDILVEGIDGQPPVADQPVGWLATTVTLYDALEKDIRRAFPSIHKAVGKVAMGFGNSPLCMGAAKTVAVLQILGNLPITVQNVAGLMHSSVELTSQRDAVEAAVKQLVADKISPLGEENGELRFYSEKLNDIEQERAAIPLRSIETRRVSNEALREVFTPLPSTRLNGTLAVSSGLKAVSGSLAASLAGDRDTIQTLVEFVPPNDYDTARTRLVDESRQRSAQHTIFLVGRSNPDIDDKVAEIYRCQEISQRFRNDPDQEVKEYCAGQLDKAERIRTHELMPLLRKGLLGGSFIFRGQTTAVTSLDQDLTAAANKNLASVAQQVFDRYGEAPERADTALAEKFLRLGNLKAVTSQLDPLSLVQIVGGTPRIKTDHKAITSMRDHLDKQGTVDGKRLSDHFGDAPFGWSPDTLRYLIAAMLVAGEVKLKVAGREVTVNGQQAIDALKTNQSFKTVGVSLRDERPSMELLARAAERMTDLVGDTVVPLEDEISKAATKSFPQFQHQFGPLAEKLTGLGLPGADKVQSLTHDLAEIMQSDASDAAQRIGAPDSSLHFGLKWASAVERGLKQGLEQTVRDLQNHRKEIGALPDMGVPGQLKADLADELTQLKDRLGQSDFYCHAADLNTTLTGIRSRVRDAATAMATGQKQAIKDAQQDLQRLPEWPELTQEEQGTVLGELDGLSTETTSDLGGFKTLLNQDFMITTKCGELKRRIETLGRKRKLDRFEEEKAKAKKAGQTKLTRTVSVPSAVRSVADLDGVITQLNGIKDELALYSEIDVTIQVKG
ncbi:MAG: BREX system P-loop protein BrxC [Phycisphaeraceae bacterium]|nr:BREX system P-loop protein BrxC [Phycisphaeraceae bacterium]